MLTRKKLMRLINLIMVHLISSKTRTETIEETIEIYLRSCSIGATWSVIMMRSITCDMRSGETNHSYQTSS